MTSRFFSFVAAALMAPAFAFAVPGRELVCQPLGGGLPYKLVSTDSGVVVQTPAGQQFALQDTGAREGDLALLQPVNAQTVPNVWRIGVEETFSRATLFGFSGELSFCAP